jgi:hypothetical protein
MGNLASFLQSEFPKHLPTGWSCLPEVHILSPDLRELLGYSSKVDILLERECDHKRLWIEFEVSRADPVANHVKFATAHLFQPQKESDVFISMISSHVTRGRRNLASNTISLMREVGMSAFQTVLLPYLPPSEVKRINHLEREFIAQEPLDIAAEISRAMIVSEAVIDEPDKRLYFASDLLDVFLNLRRWNAEISSDSLAMEKWGKRTIKYFVFDSFSCEFAPSKFCAYLGETRKLEGESRSYFSHRFVMTIDFYVTLDGVYSRFDGHRAKSHLTQGLGMESVEFSESGSLSTFFEQWLKKRSHVIRVHPKGPIFLVSPEWFR